MEERAMVNQELTNHPDARPEIVCGYCDHRADQHSLGFCSLCQEDCIAKWYKVRPVWAMVKDWKE